MLIVHKIGYCLLNFVKFFFQFFEGAQNLQEKFCFTGEWVILLQISEL
jgi:hypothetical protein